MTAPVTPETLTREMTADLLAATSDIRVATDCQALLSGRGGRAKLGLIRERVASAYNRHFTDAINARRSKEQP